MDTNVVVLVGRSTRDVEVRYVGNNNTAVATLGLAINGRKNGEQQEEVTFVDVTLWGRTAEVAAEYAGKGKQVAVTGRLRQETWENDGQKRSKIVVVAENLQLLGGGNAANQANSEAQGEAPQSGEAPKRGRGRPKAEKPANVGVGNDEEVPF